MRSNTSYISAAFLGLLCAPAVLGAAIDITPLSERTALSTVAYDTTGVAIGGFEPVALPSTADLVARAGDPVSDAIDIARKPTPRPPLPQTTN